MAENRCKRRRDAVRKPVPWIIALGTAVVLGALMGHLMGQLFGPAEAGQAEAGPLDPPPIDPPPKPPLPVEIPQELLERLKKLEKDQQRSLAEELREGIARLSGLVARCSEEIARLSVTNPPVGTVMAFAGPWPPKKPDGSQWTERELGWLLCDGRKWDDPTLTPLASELANLRAALGPDARRLPDFVGYFLRGLDRRTDGTSSGRDKEPNRAIRSMQGFSTALPNVPFVLSTQPPLNPANGDYDRLLHHDKTHTVGGGATDDRDATGSEPNLAFSGRIRAIPEHSHTFSGGGDPETRPVNVAVHWIIKFK